MHICWNAISLQVSLIGRKLRSARKVPTVSAEMFSAALSDRTTTRKVSVKIFSLMSLL